MNEDRMFAAGQTGEEMTLEEAFEQLDSVVEALESREISLEDSFRKYQEGMNLLKLCNDKIDQVEKKILVMNGDGGLDEF
ncbi:MAG: exodeoxyribonuclease VII small subunit [Lachnospiraceae bacterium]|nr:exodeoxyribonuclease VII small subunit [Lachnospiraceae bacterium]